MVKYSASLDATFRALADPTRRAILERLARGPVSVGELAAPFAMSLPAISKHLGVLESAGLLVRERDGRLRRCGLEAAPMREAAEWMARYQRFWQSRLDALARYLDEAGRGEPATEERSLWESRPAAPRPRSTSAAPSPPRARRSSPPGRTPRR